MNILDRLNEDNKKEFWAALALRYCEGISPRLLARILRHYGSAYTAYQALTENNQLQNFDTVIKKISPEIRYRLKNNSWRENALTEWHDAQKTDCEVILWTDYRYPLALKHIIDAPPFFYAKGNVGLLSYPNIAIVGARKSRPKSLERAEQIAEELSELGIAVVSGMALGIDQAAHRGALKGKGKTIAVLGTGINAIYPKQHAELYHDIAEQGLIISEFSPFTGAAARNFPIRNRLITGISEGVLIVEAALKSGSLITARLALEQNKNVYVCRPLDKFHSLGGQKLLEEGALCIDDSQGIIAELVPQFMTEYEHLKKEADKQQTKEKLAPKSKEENETEKSPLASIKPVEKTAARHYPAQKILARPRIDDNLKTLNIDFSTLALKIVNKKSTIVNPIKNSVPAKKITKKTTEKEYTAPTSIEYDNPILAILQHENALTADEILLRLRENTPISMAELSSELLMLEVDGIIEKGAGANYSIVR